MDVESDLGIDSIKRVEILSAFQRQQDGEGQARLQRVMESLTARKTLRELIAAICGALSAAGTEVHSVEAATQASDHSETASLVEPPDVVEVPRLTLTAVPTPVEKPRRFKGRLWLITDDEDGLADLVEGRLVDLGERAVVLRQGTEVVEHGERRYGADLTRSEHVADVLERIRRAHGSPAGILHLLPLRPSAGLEALSIEDWRARVQSDIKTLYVLVRAAADDLIERGRSGGAMVVAVTSLGPSLVGEAADALPTHGGVAPLLKTAAAEMPEVGWRAIHLDASRGAAERAHQLIAEVGSMDGPLEVGYAAGERLAIVPRLAPLGTGNGAPSRRASAEAGTLVREGVQVSREWVFLITGGARGITAEIAAYLASTFKPTLVLAGLSAPSEREAADTAAIADPQQLKAALAASLRAARPAVKPSEVDAAWRALLRDREIRATLAALRLAGARVEYHAVDVRDEAAFGALIDGIYLRHGRLDAVIHGAGIIEDKLLRDKTPESFDRVVQTKTDSAFTLVRRLRPGSLKLLVFMSSVTATFGNRGQADYGAANGVLNALATLLSSRWPARVLAVNWGPWDKTGMVSAEVKRQFTSRGIQVIPPAAGGAAIAREMRVTGSSDPIVVVGAGPWVSEASWPLAQEVTA
jgi:NAD(P)-dependent dehydrogenase (short-subunit alcohol dehydrogenase family)